MPDPTEQPSPEGIDESSHAFQCFMDAAFRATDIKMPWRVGESILGVLRHRAVNAPRVQLTRSERIAPAGRSNVSPCQ